MLWEANALWLVIYDAEVAGGCICGLYRHTPTHIRLVERVLLARCRPSSSCVPPGDGAASRAPPAAQPLAAVELSSKRKNALALLVLTRCLNLCQLVRRRRRRARESTLRPCAIRAS